MWEVRGINLFSWSLRVSPSSATVEKKIRIPVRVRNYWTGCKHNIHDNEWKFHGSCARIYLFIYKIILFFYVLLLLLSFILHQLNVLLMYIHQHIYIVTSD